MSEEAVTIQRIADLRQKVLENKRAGRPPNHGIDQEELRGAIKAVSSRRSEARAPSAKKASKKKEDEPVSPEAIKALEEKLKALGIDLG